MVIYSGYKCNLSEKVLIHRLLCRFENILVELPSKKINQSSITSSHS